MEFETSEEKQKRLECYLHNFVEWSCYIDCAFWNGEYCTNYEIEKLTLNNNITIDK